MDRRRFVMGTLASGSVLALGACPKPAARRRTRSPGPAEARAGVEFSDPELRRLADIALNTARAAGASYADIRIADYQRQRIGTRENRVQYVNDSGDRGFGVRVIVNGTWGFAASAKIEEAEVVRVARQAAAIARIGSKLTDAPIELAPVEAYEVVWNTPIRTDPFEVALSEKIDTLLSINATAMANKGVKFCSSQMDFVREHKFFASTEGSYIEQTLHRNNPGFTVTAVDDKSGAFETRNSYSDPQGVGYEYVAEYPWAEDAAQAAEDVTEKLAAPSVKPGVSDLILHPTNLWLTIHESIGHPTELDRALGMEANYAGTSFLTTDKLGKLQLGSSIVNFTGEKTAVGSLATCGYDDEGVKTTSWPMVVDGVFVDYQTTREQASWIGRKASHGTCYAQSWKDVPFQRMPNINLEPGVDGLSEADLIASTDEAILVKGRGSYSIDHQRYNFQFSGQTFYQIKGGKITGMLRDVAYQARTPEFWNACDAICGADEYYVGGSFYDGKGEPGQVNAVSHGCCPSRFRNINILNTARKV